MNIKILTQRPAYGTYPFNISVSKAKTFKDCAAKYRYSYIEKLPKKDWDFHVFGKFLHRVFELFHLSTIQFPDFLHCKTTMSEWMSSAKDKAFNEFGSKLSDKQKEESFAIIENYFNKFCEDQRNKIAPKILAVEKEFFIDLDGKILLNGVIDREQIDPDGIINCADYKTSKDTKFLKKDDFQLLTYCFVECLWNPELKKIRGSYIMLKHNFEVIGFEYSRDEAMIIAEKFVNYAKEIQEEKVFLPKTGPLCAYCDAAYIESYQGKNIKPCNEGIDFVKMLEAKKAKKEREANSKGKSVFGESEW